jgi:hypothetical protein
MVSGRKRSHQQLSRRREERAERLAMVFGAGVDTRMDDLDYGVMRQCYLRLDVRSESDKSEGNRNATLRIP